MKATLTSRHRIHDLTLTSDNGGPKLVYDVSKEVETLVAARVAEATATLRTERDDLLKVIEKVGDAVRDHIEP